MGFHGESENAAGREQARCALHDGRQVVEVDEDVGGEDEIVLRAAIGVGDEEVGKSGSDKMIV